MKFEVGKKYKLLRSGKWGWGGTSASDGDIVTCHRVDSDGAMWSRDVTYLGDENREGRGWCVVGQEELNEKLVVEVLE